MFNVNKESRTPYEIDGYTFRVREDHRHITIWYEGKPVGTLCTALQPSGWCLVKKLEVRADHRSQGLGTALYGVLFALMPDNEYGITGDIRQRANQVEIPKMFARFSGYIQDEYTVYIPKNGYIPK